MLVDLCTCIIKGLDHHLSSHRVGYTIIHRVPLCVAQAIYDYMVNDYVQLEAGYEASTRADQTVQVCGCVGMVIHNELVPHWAHVAYHTYHTYHTYTYIIHIHHRQHISSCRPI